MENDKRIIRFVPNALTILRIFLTVIFLAMIIMAGRMEEAKPGNYMTIAFVLFIITALTDIVAMAKWPASLGNAGSRTSTT